jgi:ABC-type Zn uptake system ZnuABC Zn-binding protein ZnuA
MKGRRGRPFKLKPMVLRFVLVMLWVALAVPAAAQERIAVVTTTTDLRSLVEAVGGDRVTAIALVPPRIDAEEYQPKPQDVSRLKTARLVIRVGLDYDLWFDRLLAQAGSAEINRGGPGYVDASYAIATLEVRGSSVGPGDGHAHGNGNPHYWLDPKNAEIITSNILEGLARVDPSHIASYEANRVAFLRRLDAKLVGWSAALAPLQGRPLIAYHNTWAYFARRFRLNFIASVEPKPGVPPSAFQLAYLLRLMRDQNARILVRQPHEPEKDLRFLADKTGAAVIVLAGSVGMLPGGDDYISLFDANVSALLAAGETQ